MLTETVSGERKAGSNSLVPLDTLGGLAKASIAAGDKSLDKAEQHYKSAGLYLAEAKERVARTKNLTWPAYLIKHCPIGRRQADLYIEMAEGRTSLAEVREGYKQRNAKRGNGRVHTQPAGNHQQEQEDSPRSSVRASSDSIDPSELVQDDHEDSEEEWAIKGFMFAVEGVIHSARDSIEYIENVSLSEESAKKLENASETIGTAWNEVKSVINQRRIKADRASLAAKPAPKKLSPEKLEARRKRMADNKTYDDYFKQFGALYGVLDRARYNLMAASLASGVDQLADVRREQEEYADKQAEHVRAKTLRRATINAPLLAPITPEKERAYMGLIKRRQLYEGACALSWQEYFDFRDAHPDCALLTRGDLAYASDWTACAVIPEMDESTVTEKALRERAARHGYKVRRRGTEYSLTDDDGTGPGGSLEGVIDWLDLIEPTASRVDGNEQEDMTAHAIAA